MPKSTDYRTLIQKFSHLFREAPDLTLENMEEQAIVKITLYFKPCYYGETRLRVKEWFNSDDEKVQYRYSWEKIEQNLGISARGKMNFMKYLIINFPMVWQRIHITITMYLLIALKFKKILQSII